MRKQTNQEDKIINISQQHKEKVERIFFLFNKNIQQLKQRKISQLRQNILAIRVQQQFHYISYCKYGVAFVIFTMKKRKLDINEIKKLTLRGKQSRTITTKYEAALSFFKQKDQKSNPIFLIQLQPLIIDLLDQLSNAQITYKLQNSLSGEIHEVEIAKDLLKIDISCLKHVCKEYPIKEIMECLEIKKDQATKKVIVQVINTKLMVFFKHLRSIFPDICLCVGEKIIIDGYDLKSFYQTFKLEWAKLYERGRMDACEKIQKLLCRSIYFIGVLIQNNIFSAILQQQRLKKQQTADFGTKSQKKKHVKGITHQVSSTYSFGGEIDLLSSFSHTFSPCLLSQKSNQESFCKTGFSVSQKSQRQIKKQKNCNLWNSAQLGELKIKMQPQFIPPLQNSRFQVDLLSNDVQNILIEQAFKIHRLKDQWDRNRYFHIDYGMYNNSYANYYPQYYHNYPYPNSSQYIYTQIVGSQENNTNYQNKRNVHHPNLVETRKTHSRLESHKY